MYSIVFSDSAQKQLFKLEKALQERIIRTLERIRVRPESFVTKLVNDPAYKLRVGDYRVLLDIDQQEILILVIEIGHRKNVYD
ncbi:MAG TPA: type II toxin-antitoxin system RelE/ParE family toxin [Candidatus Hodarchaeales archaeon]|nr:type II toxin-antitoxin system RelE/ParE family toxin [Candidatus Hodarchaeales archaeon]HLC84481.1 type II toxin-antitoxin system RelE/ParE family toxin [Candidatus Nanoarchaeia archaeon]